MRIDDYWGGLWFAPVLFMARQQNTQPLVAHARKTAAPVLVRDSRDKERKKRKKIEKRVSVTGRLFVICNISKR